MARKGPTGRAQRPVGTPKTVRHRRPSCSAECGYAVYTARAYIARGLALVLDTAVLARVAAALPSNTRVSHVRLAELFLVAARALGGAISSFVTRTVSEAIEDASTG